MGEKEDEKYINTLIRDEMARKRFKETPTKKEAAAVMRSLAKTDASWIREFNRDEGRMHRGALAFYDHAGVLKGNGTILKIAREEKKGGNNAYHYLVVTASHVADLVPAPQGTHWTRHPEGRDVAVRELTEDELARAKAESDALLLPPLQKGREDITGEIGAVIAHGNGKNAPVRKLYPSRLSPKISFPVMTAMNIGLPVPRKYMYEEDFNEMRAMAVPYNEAMKGLHDQPPPMNRVSGGAFVHLPRGSRELSFGGFLVAGVKAFGEGVSYDIGFVLDHMYTRETIAEHEKMRGVPSAGSR